MVSAEQARLLSKQNETPICQVVTKVITNTANIGGRSVLIDFEPWLVDEFHDRLTALGYQVFKGEYNPSADRTNLKIQW